MATTATLSWQPLYLHKHRRPPLRRRHAATVRAFRRGDLDRFARRVTSGEAWRDAWRSANDGFELLVFEAKKTAERIDRQYSVSRRLNSAARAATDRAREMDREFEISLRWRTFSMDFSRNWPRYRKQLNDFLNTPLGRSFATIFFLWFALSGWLFRILILATWVLPIAAPLLIGTVANNLVIKGACPACKREFVGYKNQIIRCTSCGNIVWQPQGDFFSRQGRGKNSSKSDADIIDVDFEEK
ncbi:Replicase polyprotein 1ab [Melia azedarach]|uniref:Replicase polyprotein 1ab n=2 Tax=Melia azedarach TaxID=155640 RepID=A0ACC1YEM3_MELAZ|nr:Replicase polyprotein 1ab [Melia azedarach]KAJ4721468.1 Replicase polyprotein 1ab [Melia azedarach]